MVATLVSPALRAAASVCCFADRLCAVQAAQCYAAGLRIGATGTFSAARAGGSMFYAMWMRGATPTPANRYVDDRRRRRRYVENAGAVVATRCLRLVVPCYSTRVPRTPVLD